MKRIGRLRFLAYSVLVNILFLLPLSITFEMSLEINPGATIVERAGTFFMVLFVYNVFMSVLIERRANDIGFINGTFLAFFWFIASMLLVLWSYDAVIQGDEMGMLTSSASILLFSIIANIYFVCMPSTETREFFKNRMHLNKRYKSLLKEKYSLEQEQKIKSLQEEIQSLKAAPSNE